MKVKDCIEYLNGYINLGNSENDEVVLLFKPVYDQLREKVIKLRKLEDAGVSK